MPSAGPLVSRKIYEDGGWADGRLGQAYDLIADVLGENRDHAGDLTADLQRAMDLAEECDAELERLATVAEWAGDD